MEMARQAVFQPSPAVAAGGWERRPQFVVVGKDAAAIRGGRGHHERRASFREVAGETAADCAAVACCCPCVLVNLMVLAVYKVPTGICRKAIKSTRRRTTLLKKSRWPERHHSFSDSSDLQIFHISPAATSAVTSSLGSDKDVVELENEMWEKFYGAGFWRSLSHSSDLSELSR